MDEGRDGTPTVSVKIENGKAVNHQSNTFVWTVNSTNDAAAATTAASHAGDLPISVLLSASNFGITDPDATSFTYTVSSVTHGTFQTFDGATWNTVTSFTSAQLRTSTRLNFNHGSNATPTFSVQVDNGEAVNHQSNTFVGTVSFTNAAAPVISALSLHDALPISVLLSASNFGITDPDATSFTYTVSSVTHGTFQTFDGATWNTVTSFTSA